MIKINLIRNNKAKDEKFEEALDGLRKLYDKYKDKIPYDELEELIDSLKELEENLKEEEGDSGN